MQLTINKDDFSDALLKAQGVVDKRNPLQICSNVLLEAKAPNQLHITATDLDVTIEGEYPCVVHESGAVAVGAKSLHDMIKALPPGPVELKSEDNNWLQVSNGNIDFRLVGMPALEFPKLSKPEKLEGFNISSQVLCQMVDRVKFTVSTDDGRPTLNGMFIQGVKSEDGTNKLEMVSTDGHRLSKVVKEVEGEINLNPRGMIVPRKGFIEFNKIFGNWKEDVFFGWGGNQAVFRTPKETLTIRLIDGTFPDFSSVIPRSSQNVLRLEKDSFLNSLRRAIVVADNKNTGCSLKVKGNKSYLKMINPEIGQIEEELVATFEGNDLEIGYNVYYLNECVGAIGGDTILFELNDSVSPGVLKSSPEDESFYVVMPMRL